MKSRKLLTLLLAAILAGGFAYARQDRNHTDVLTDSLKKSHKILLFGEDGVGVTDTRNDSIRQLVELFYYDQFRQFQDPSAPYFLFMSRDAQLAMGIGGCVRMRGWYDWGGSVNANGFAPYLISMNPDMTHNKKLGTTPAGSSLFFRVLGRNKVLGHYQVYIEANFNGYQSRDFHLKKAYAIVNNWTIGYANSTFSDPAAQSPFVDAQGANNKITPTNVLVRKMFEFKKGWSLALSLETPSTAVANTTYTKKVDEWLPDFAAFVQYQWEESSHLRLAGILRTLSYRNLETQKNHNVMGWGAMLTSVFHPTYNITGYAGINGGHGIESLGGDLQVDNLDLVATPSKSGEMYAPASLGWNIGLQYNFNPSVFVSASYSESHLFSKKGSAADMYKYGRLLAVNCFWNLTPRIQVGAEFDLGQRNNIDGSDRWARRAGAMVQFSF